MLFERLMEVNWKSLSFSLIVSMVIHGSVLTVLFLDYVNKFRTIYNNYISAIGNQTDDKISVTLAEGTSYPPELWILLMIVSFVIVTVICYFLFNWRTKNIKGF